MVKLIIQIERERGKKNTRYRDKKKFSLFGKSSEVIP
jgi:hypothetical protein